MSSQNEGINRGTRRSPNPPRRFPPLDGFDLNAGPEALEDPERIRRSRILGNRRQEADQETLPPMLRGESLSREFKNLLSLTVGPAARGGEDLPTLSEGQIELVRFQYTQTIHQEAWSFRARQGRERIRYAIEDEYELDVSLVLRSTRAWPSLGKLIWMLDHSDVGAAEGLYFGDLSLRLESEVEAPE